MKVDWQVVGIRCMLTHLIAAKGCGGLTRMKIVQIRTNYLKFAQKEHTVIVVQTLLFLLKLGIL